MARRNPTKRSNVRRRLTEVDVSAWNKAADRRKPQMDREQIIERIKARNAYRWWRLNHDYKWLERQMKKMGLSPQDARELL